jgi:hypothetical protein
VAADTPAFSAAETVYTGARQRCPQPCAAILKSDWSRGPRLDIHRVLSRFVNLLISTVLERTPQHDGDASGLQCAEIYATDLLTTTTFTN